MLFADEPPGEDAWEVAVSTLESLESLPVVGSSDAEGEDPDPVGAAVVGLEASDEETTDVRDGEPAELEPLLVVSGVADLLGPVEEDLVGESEEGDPEGDVGGGPPLSR